jgi:hypothetical protein
MLTVELFIRSVGGTRRSTHIYPRDRRTRDPSARWHDSIPRNTDSDDFAIGTTPGPTRSALSRPPVESSVTSTSRSAVPPSSAVTVASSFLA